MKFEVNPNNGSRNIRVGEYIVPIAMAYANQRIWGLKIDIDELTEEEKQSLKRQEKHLANFDAVRKIIKEQFSWVKTLEDLGAALPDLYELFEELLPNLTKEECDYIFIEKLRRGTDKPLEAKFTTSSPKVYGIYKRGGFPIELIDSDEH